MNLVDLIVKELQQEAAVTRRVLERVPAEKFDWKPHEKSMSLGQLANHVATTPGGVAKILEKEEVDLTGFKPPPLPESLEALLAAHDQSIAEACAVVQRVGEHGLPSAWRLLKEGREILKSTKLAVMRSIMLNHWYHHRGQLSVYLRLLDIPLPSIYGPSADENPFSK